MSLSSHWNVPSEIWQEVVLRSKPNTIADYISLLVLATATVTYISRGIFWDRPDPYRHLAFERPQLKHGQLTSSFKPKETRNIARKLDEVDKNIVIFWGSQSGTAEGFAHRLARDIALRFGKGTITADLSDYDPVTITQIPDTKLAIFILSTYGEGDASDNTAGFWDWVNKESQKIYLFNLRYVAFGLGNTNYKFYNKVVDVTVEFLQNCGAISLMPVGKANDAKGTTQEDFMSWKDDLFIALKDKLGFQEIEQKYTPSLVVQEDESLRPIDLYHGAPGKNADALRSMTVSQCSPVRPLNISISRELFSSPDRNCVHMEFDLINQPELRYKTGDHLGVWPSNPDTEVDILLKSLGHFSRSQVPVIIKSLDPETTKVALSTPTTIGALFRYYLEICAPVNRDTVKDLAQFAPSPDSKAFLLKLGQNKESYAELKNRTYLNIGRLMALAAPKQIWSNIPLAYIVESLPHIQPRYYSISSSSVVSPRKISITAVVSSSTLQENLDQVVHGVTSNYLLALSNNFSRSLPHPKGLNYHLNGPGDCLQGNKVLAHIRRSQFKLPASASTPVIMIAAGTGLAPFRAFIAERHQLMQIGSKVGEMILFFGCRNPDEDYIYRDELQKMQAVFGDNLLRIVTSFSRLRSQTHQYVQGGVSDYCKDVVRLIDEGANLYICGKAGMARDVEKTVSDEIRRMKAWTEEEVNMWSKTIKKTHKWQEDVWG